MKKALQDQAFFVWNTGNGPEVGDACGNAISPEKLEGKIIKLLKRMPNGNLCIMVENSPLTKAAQQFDQLFR